MPPPVVFRTLGYPSLATGALICPVEGGGRKGGTGAGRIVAPVTIEDAASAASISRRAHPGASACRAMAGFGARVRGIAGTATARRVTVAPRTAASLGAEGVPGEVVPGGALGLGRRKGRGGVVPLTRPTERIGTGGRVGTVP